MVGLGAPLLAVLARDHDPERGPQQGRDDGTCYRAPDDCARDLAAVVEREAPESERDSSDCYRYSQDKAVPPH